MLLRGIMLYFLYNDKSCSRGMCSAIEGRGGEGHIGVLIRGVYCTM